MRKLLLSVSLSCSYMLAQTSTTYPGSFNGGWQIAGGLVPNSTTAVTSSTGTVDYIVLSNTTGSAVTVTITDNSTNCNSGVCQLLPAVSIPANTVYSVPCGGVVMTGGLKWSSSSATAVHAWAKGKTL